MSLRHWLAASLFGVLSAPFAAHAAGPGAFIWDGEYWGFTYDAFEQGLTAGGATPVDRAPDLPADLSAYNLVVVVLPSSAPSAGATAQLRDFVTAGGVLMLVSDFDGYAPEPSGIFNALSTELGIGARFTSGTVYGCSDEATVHDHPLTAGLTGFHSAAPDFITLGSAATSLVETTTGDPFLAVEGNVLLLADSNPINTFVCSPADTNAPFFAALPAFACDVDGDGVENASCGGTDPDDLDATITEEPMTTGSGGGSSAGGQGSGASGSGASSSTGGSSSDDGASSDDGCTIGNRPSSTSSMWVAALALAAIGSRRRRSRS